MLKNIIFVWLFAFSSNLYSQEINLFQCAEIKKMANSEFTESNINLLSQGVSQKKIELNIARGLVRSQIASKAAELDLDMQAYASSLYSEKCQQKPVLTLAKAENSAE